MWGPGDGEGAGSESLAGLEGALSINDVCDGQVEEEAAGATYFPFLLQWVASPNTPYSS